jgi:hypothetical protein
MAGAGYPGRRAVVVKGLYGLISAIGYPSPAVVLGES